MSLEVPSVTIRFPLQRAASSTFDTKALLVDEKKLQFLCDRATELSEFPQLLLDFFTSQKRTLPLIEWAVRQDLMFIKNTTEAFRLDSLCTRLLSCLFFSDLGKKYLRHALEPILTAIFSPPEQAQKYKMEGWLLVNSKKYYARLKDDHLALYKHERKKHSKRNFPLSGCTFSESPKHMLEMTAVVGHEKHRYTLDAQNIQESEEWSNILRCYQSANMDPHVLLKVVKSFLQHLVQSIELCPLIIREALTSLQNLMTKCCDNVSPTYFVSLMFLRYYCPPLISPVQYQLLESDDHLNAVTTEKLLILSKFINGLAVQQEQGSSQGKRLSDAPRYSQGASQFISRLRLEDHVNEEYLQECNKLLTTFGERFSDTNEIRLHKKIVENSVDIPKSFLEASQIEAERNLRTYLRTYNVSIDVKPRSPSKELVQSLATIRSSKEFLAPSDSGLSNLSGRSGSGSGSELGCFVLVEEKIKDALSQAKELYLNEKWNLVEESSKKKWAIYKSASMNWQWKLTFLVDISKEIWCLIHREKKLQFIQESQYGMVAQPVYQDDERVDYSFNLKLPFPFSDRDFVLSQQFQESFCDHFADVGFSIDRPDKPISKKAVRGHMSLCYVCEETSSSSKVQVTLIINVDPKGKLPVWLIQTHLSWNKKIIKAAKKAYEKLSKDAEFSTDVSFDS